MESLFTFLSNIANFLVSFVPHFTIVKTTHAGVKFKKGNTVLKITSENGLYFPKLRLSPKFVKFERTGIHIYWPILSEVMVVPIKRQTTKLDKQILTTKDNLPIMTNGIVVYEVENPVKLLTDTWDYEDTIKDYATFCLRKTITENNFEDIKNLNLTPELKKYLKKFGIKVIRVALSDLSTGRPIIHIGSMIESHNHHSELFK